MKAEAQVEQQELEVRAAEVMGVLSLATDLATGLPFEHGLHSTLVAMRLADRLDVDSETRSQTYYACLLFYVGCTADAEVAAELFPDEDALATHLTPVIFGSRAEVLTGLMRSVPTPGRAAPVRAWQIAGGLRRAAKGRVLHIAALCEVGQMLTHRLGLPRSVEELFGHLAERWDGKGLPGRVRGVEIPMAVRIAHVARDAVVQRAVGGEQHAASVIRQRAGHAFDPDIAALLVDEAPAILALESGRSAWEETLSCEPSPRLALKGQVLDRALAAMGDFADLSSPYLVGHSAGVAELATGAGEHSDLRAADVTALRRAALVHDIGRVAVPTRIWQKPGALTPDEWERVRLHSYQSERVLSRCASLADLAPIASAHHERLDGSGYHCGTTAAGLPTPARLLAAADAYHAMTEPRPHRPALSPERAGQVLADEARAGRLCGEAVAALLEASGQRPPRIERPAGLTQREAEVIGLLARGLQTKQVARTLGISSKTADRHVQNAYRKIGVSTRAAAALFAMEHGLAKWGELPIGGDADRS